MKNIVVLRFVGQASENKLAQRLPFDQMLDEVLTVWAARTIKLSGGGESSSLQTPVMNTDHFAVNTGRHEIVYSSGQP